jgi:imidazolonepropionase-like amidohydrolase
MARGTFSGLAVAALVAVSAAGAQVDPGPGRPPGVVSADYALTNVRIVTAPGRVIDRGTVLIRDGRITAVGASVTVPAGVVTMDLPGHSVFPGLIDAATNIGLPSAYRPIPTADASTTGRGGRGGRGGGGGGRGNPAGLVPTVNATPIAQSFPSPEVDAQAEAADMFAPTPGQLETLRAGGITTVGLVFDGGLFPGRIGAALTGGPDESRLALRADAGQEVSFGTRRGGYPSTGIGAIAYVRQSLLDAQYEARLDKAFKAGIPGARPSNEPFTRALVPVATNEMPAWFVASPERQINRVGEIAREMGIKSPVVVGAQEGWRVIPTLKAMGATAVVSLNWPNPATVTGATFKNPIGGGTVPANDPAAMQEVRSNAAALVKAGIPVALASYGGETGASFRDRIRSSIEAGLSPDDALRAATVTPAQLLGITAAVGTIEVGKLANLVVVPGNDLFASGAAIKHVFVEGRLY